MLADGAEPQKPEVVILLNELLISINEVARSEAKEMTTDERKDNRWLRLRSRDVIRWLRLRGSRVEFPGCNTNCVRAPIFVPEGRGWICPDCLSTVVVIE